MRTFGVTLVSLLVAAAPLAAQPPGNNPVIPTPGSGAPPALNPSNRLDQLLMQWEARMKNVDAVWVQELMRTDKDKDGTVKVFKGEARFLKPNFAALQLVRTDNPALYEMKITTGNLAYDFRPQSKKLFVYELPPQSAAALKNAGLLSFINGMGAAETKQRFDMTLTKDADGTQQPFVYIEVRPKLDEDKREFVRAQLVLVASTMLPRRLWMVTANGAEVTYDLTKMNVQTPLKPADFVAPNKPDGWEQEYVPLNRQPVTPASQPPRIARPAAPNK